MKSPFALLRKWWKNRQPREAVPPWHVTLKLRENITAPKLSGEFVLKVPDHCRFTPRELITAKVQPQIQISVHTETSHHE